MGIAGVERPSRTISWAGWLIRGIGLGLVGSLLLWFAHLQSEHAQLQSGSTFEIQWGEIAIVQFLYLLYGAVFAGLVLIARREPTKRSGLIVGGIIPTLIPLLIFWDLAGPALVPDSYRIRLMWVWNSDVQFPSAVAVGVMVTALVWQAVSTRRPVPDPAISPYSDSTQGPTP